MTDFNIARETVELQLKEMDNGTTPVFEADISGDILWEIYLTSFRPEDNPLYITNTVHDCSCCKQFIRRAGAMVTINDDNTINTVWDREPSEAYKKGFAKMAEAVRAAPIKGRFFTKEPRAGDIASRVMVGDKVVRFDHFAHRFSDKVFKSGIDVGRAKNLTDGDAQVLGKALRTFSVDNLVDVIELSAGHGLYRALNLVPMMKGLMGYVQHYQELPENQRGIFLLRVASQNPMVARFANTSLGELLVNMAAGDSLETAVAKYETMVAPQNYRRSSAVVTTGMIEKARASLDAAGLLPAVTRRMATIDDMPVEEAIYVYRPVAEQTDAFQDMSAEKSKEFDGNKDRAIKMDWAAFQRDVLGGCRSIEVCDDETMTSHVVALTTGEEAGLFPWASAVGWSYNAGVADSMRDKVEKAGGKVNGVLRASLAWNEGEHDRCDLDLHALSSNERIYYGRKHGGSTGGVLDIDIITPRPGVAAVENIIWVDADRIRGIDIEILVNNYSSTRGSQEYTVEIEYDGALYQFNGTALRGNQIISVATVAIDNKGKSTITGKAKPSGHRGGVFKQVNMIIKSPNYWSDDKTGNEHTFFLLEDGRKASEVRGFYNEQLKPELKEHRKVLETIGGRSLADKDGAQLSGFGVSSTTRKEIVARVDGKKLFIIEM